MTDAVAITRMEAEMLWHGRAGLQQLGTAMLLAAGAVAVLVLAGELVVEGGYHLAAWRRHWRTLRAVRRAR